MYTPTTPLDWTIYLSALHDAERPQLRSLSNEYELIAPRAYMHPELLRELGDRLQQVVIAWPQLVVDSLEERLDIEGFRLPDAAEADDDLWRVWQENGCDEESQLAHIDALTMKRSYICVGTNEDDETTPLVTFESALELYADLDPRTRKVRAALRRWADNQNTVVRTQERYATLYLPDVTIFYDATNGWKEIDRDEHGLGEVPVAPIVNRARLSDRRGRSELTPIMPLAHAANKLATDMMVAAEFVALPLRGMFGVGPDDLEDIDGNKLTALQAILGRMLMIPDADGTGKQFEFTSANLANFHDSINQLARLVASLAGLPPHFLGLATDNPPSADAIRASEARLVKRAERKQRAFGGAHEQAMRLVRRMQTGDWDPAFKRLETIWRDASTPTVAQAADAAVKLYNLPAPIVPLRQTRETLGYSQVQIERMEAEDDKQAVKDDARAAEMFKLPTAAAQVGGQPPAVPVTTGAPA